VSKVFVVQVPAKRENGQWVPKYDLSAAEVFGELVPILPFGNVPSDPEPTRSAMWRALGSFDTAADSLLLLGDPVAIAQAVSVMSTNLPLTPFRVLKWDRRAQRYEPYWVG
jgi:hypothetical protein